MTRVEVVKHYSVASFRTVTAAEARRAEIAARHPDRDYVITANSRASYIKYKVEQVKTVVLDVPDLEKDLHAPVPDRASYGRDMERYWADRAAWQQHVDAVMAPIFAPLLDKMNP